MLTAATCPMPGLSVSYSKYLLGLNPSVHLSHPTQPLLRISSATRDDQMLNPGGEPKEDNKPRTFHSYKAPELVTVEPIPAGLWKQLQTVPWLLHRVEGLLHALPFAASFWQNAEYLAQDIEAPVISPEVLMEKLICVEIEGEKGASPGHLVRGLTLANANDRWNMERLEILGDAFLKYSVTVFFYYKMTNLPRSREHRHQRIYNEGDLTCARSRVVGNHNLYQVAKTLKLPEGAIRYFKLLSL